MELGRARKESPINTAHLELTERELLVASPNGYHQLEDFSSEESPNNIYNHPVKQETYAEVHDYADHTYIDTRAPESIRWESTADDLANVPVWARAVVETVLFPPKS
jgi:hypothetical protein